MHKVKHCDQCGAPYPAPVSGEAVQCAACGHTRYFNPTGIAVLLQPVYSVEFVMGRQITKLGLLLGQRGIQPMLGQWCLPGGFCSPADQTYEAAALRECWEEVTMPSHNYDFRQDSATLLFSLPGDRMQILAFSEASHALPLSWLPWFAPNSECSAVRVLWPDEDPAALCFPAHAEAARRWQATRRDVAYTRMLGLTEERDHAHQRGLALQKACAHSWVDAPDLYDYHKREEFSRCTLCGLTR